MTAWFTYVLEHPAALIALVTKISGITFWSTVLARRVPDRLTSWLHAWLGVQTFQIATIIALSAFSALSRTATWASLIMLMASGLMAYIAVGQKFHRPSLRDTFLVVLIAIPLVLWVLRSAILPDFTPDAQTYGSVRIGLWMNYRSVMVHMPTAMVNIFADEWNGELNGLLYAFSADNIQGAVMGNAEILIVATLASIWAARRFGAGDVGSALIGLLMATSPAFIGLAAVTKGDLLACVGVLMAVGILERPTAKSVCLALVWFALASGSKISVLPAAAIILGCMFMISADLFFDRKAVGMLAVAGGFSALFVARFVANVVVYHHPFMRVGAETAEPGINTLIGNMSLIGDRFVGFFPVSPSGLMFSTSLAAGFGVCGWLAAAGAATGRLRLPGMHATLAILCATSVGATAFLIPPRIWGFRYFLPVIVVLAIMGLVAFTQAVDRLPANVRGVAIFAVIVAAVFDYRMCFTPGDISSPHDFKYAMNWSIDHSPLQRTMLPYPEYVDEVQPDKLGIDAGRPMTFAVLNEISSMVLAFEGSRAQNRVYLADSAETLVSEAESKNADYVVLAKAPSGSTLKPFDIPGYHWILEGQHYDIAVRD